MEDGKVRNRIVEVVTDTGSYSTRVKRNSLSSCRIITTNGRIILWSASDVTISVIRLFRQISVITKSIIKLWGWYFTLSHVWIKFEFKSYLKRNVINERLSEWINDNYSSSSCSGLFSNKFGDDSNPGLLKRFFIHDPIFDCKCPSDSTWIQKKDEEIFSDDWLILLQYTYTYKNI